MSNNVFNKEILPFFFDNKEVSTITDQNGAPWFVASTVCCALEIADTSDAVGRVDENDKLLRTLPIAGQNRNVLIINEYGLYTLIFTSNKPGARRFQRWITHEVIPAIRKNDAYSLDKSKVIIPAEEYRLLQVDRKLRELSLPSISTTKEALAAARIPVQDKKGNDTDLFRLGTIHVKLGSVVDRSPAEFCTRKNIAGFIKLQADAEKDGRTRNAIRLIYDSDKNPKNVIWAKSMLNRELAEEYVSYITSGRTFFLLNEQIKVVSSTTNEFLMIRDAEDAHIRLMGNEGFREINNANYKSAMDIIEKANAEALRIAHEKKQARDEAARIAADKRPLFDSVRKATVRPSWLPCDGKEFARLLGEAYREHLHDKPGMDGGDIVFKVVSAADVRTTHVICADGVDETLYNITDVAKLFGAEPKHRPYNWLDTKKAAAIAEDYKDSFGVEPIVKTDGFGAEKGTFVVMPMIIDYVQWMHGAGQYYPPNRNRLISSLKMICSLEAKLYESIESDENIKNNYNVEKFISHGNAVSATDDTWYPPMFDDELQPDQNLFDQLKRHAAKVLSY